MLTTRTPTSRLRPLLALVLPGVAGVYLAFQGGGVAAGAAAIVAVGFAAALLLRVQASPADAEVVGRLANAALLALPGALVLYFSFNAGGFFPGATAFAAIVLTLALVLRITLAEDPFAGFGWPLAVGAGALGLYAGWILLSATWSDSTARVLIEFDRALVYLLVLLLMGTVPRTAARLRWMLRGVALAIAVVGVAALLTRLIPDTFPAAPNLADKRLSFPLTYWNALAILTAIGVILALHFASSLRERPFVRVLAAATVPVLATATFFTFSRGGIAAGIVGLAVYVVVGRPRGLLSAAIAVVPTSVIAVRAAYHADLLGSDHPTLGAAVTQGHHLAVTVAACALGAAAIRALLFPLDAWVRRFRLPRRMRRPVAEASWIALAVGTLAVVLAAGVPHRLSTQYHDFVHTRAVTNAGDFRKRLLDPGNNGRIDHWKVARNGYETAELHGQGAGSFAVLWPRKRPASSADLTVRDAHSLYIEVLDELGLVGLLLVAGAILAMLAAFLPVGRGRHRSLYAVLLAVGVAWALHAGVDWDWEMPAVTAWLFALGGAALARPADQVRPRPLEQGTRVALGLVILAAAVTPALLLVSQRHLDASADAFERGDCRRAMDEAAKSIETLAIRPEPYEALGYCQVRQGTPASAPAALRKSVSYDPQNWEYRYGLALVEGAAGRDPLPYARAAARFNPRDRITKGLVFGLRYASPRQRLSVATDLARTERLSVVR